jgi:multidrug resistance efflux pump
MNQLQMGINELTVVADRSGMILHVTNDEGEKTSVGNKVFKGSSVATLADPDKLFITAKVPEAQIAHVFIGQAAKVAIPGANVVLAAKITSMGQVFHSKSKNQPNIVRDIELEFDAPTNAVKPGSAVQVSLVLNSEKAKK